MVQIFPSTVFPVGFFFYFVFVCELVRIFFPLSRSVVAVVVGITVIVQIVF